MEVMWRVVLTVSLLWWGICSSEAKVTCKDKNDGEVDWYILYKVPKLNNKALSGLEYFYIDSAKNEWLGPINDPTGVLARTLQPLLAHKTETPDFGFISYNDQPAGCSADQVFGHSKGVVMMDRMDTGVWLLHSTPNFPYDRRQGKLWPKSGAKHAQTFICVTFAYNQFDQIGKHLQHIWAFPFDYYIPEGFHPVLESVVKREYLKPNNPFLDQDLISLGHQKFKSFAKYSRKRKNRPGTHPPPDQDKAAADLYFHIANDLKSNLNVQSWRGRCEKGGRAINTIEFLTMTRNGVKLEWNYCQDHSKWCVTEEQSKPWTCIADLNTAVSQDGRPGGALCIERSDVREKFKGFIDHKEGCSRKRRKPGDPEQSASL